MFSLLSLHLTRTPDTSRQTLSPRNPQTYNVHLVPEDALLIGFFLASLGKIPENTLQSFLTQLRLAPYHFRSYAKAS